MTDIINIKKRYVKMIRVTVSSYVVGELKDIVIHDYDRAVTEKDIDAMCESLMVNIIPDDIKIFQQTFLQLNLNK